MLRSCFLLICLCTTAIMTYAQDDQNTSAANDAQSVAKSIDADTFVEPRFPGCEAREIPEKFKYLCSQKKFVTYLERYIKYPKEAKNAGIKGKVILSFIVEKDGSITQPQVERSPDESLSNECLEVIQLIDPNEYPWTPAIYNNMVVRSKVTMPIDFRLGYKSIKAKRPTTFINIPDIMPSVPIDAAGNSLIAAAEETDEDKVYDNVELAPYFGGCNASQSTLIDKYKCSRAAYMSYISEQIQYPQSAKANRVQGLANVEAIIEVDGTVSNPKLVRDPGSDLGEEALRIVKAMKDSVGLWSPGEVGSVPVRTRIKLPIIFRLKADEVNPLVVITDNKKNVIHDCLRMENPELLSKISGASIKKVKGKKLRFEYGEKGRYGVYKVKLPKGKGRLPASIRKQEEVEAYEMYFQGLTLGASKADKSIDILFDELSDDAKVIVYTFSGRTLAEVELLKDGETSATIPLEKTRDEIFLVSIVQKDLVHTQVVTW